MMHDWTYFLLVGLLGWVFVERLDRLGRQSSYASYRIRREMAELLGKSDRVNELKEEWDQDEKEQRKERRRYWTAFIVLIALGFVWFGAEGLIVMLLGPGGYLAD